jgi:sugar phosphate isomerase/epimerase
MRTEGLIEYIHFRLQWREDKVTQISLAQACWPCPSMSNQPPYQPNNQEKHHVRLSTRRHFLANTRSLAVAGVACSILPRAAWADAMGLPPGIQLYTIRDLLAKDAPGALKQLQEIGFREVETAGFGKYSAADFRKLLDDAGLKCPSAHVDLSKPDLGPVFADVHALGAQYATSSSLATSNMPRPAPGTPRGSMPRMGLLGLDGFTKLAAQMNEIGKKAKAAGLQYAYHNHNYEFEKMPDGSYGYDVLVKNTDHGLVKFEIDCGWMCVAGASPVHYFQTYPGRFKMIHVKDFQPVSQPSTSLSGPERPKGANLGTGFIDYKPIFAAGKKAGIQHAFSEQEEPYPVSSLESAKADYAFLHAAS